MFFGHAWWQCRQNTKAHRGLKWFRFCWWRYFQINEKNNNNNNNMAFMDTNNTLMNFEVLYGLFLIFDQIKFAMRECFFVGALVYAYASPVKIDFFHSIAIRFIFVWFLIFQMTFVAESNFPALFCLFFIRNRCQVRFFVCATKSVIDFSFSFNQLQFFFHTWYWSMYDVNTRTNKIIKKMSKEKLFKFILQLSLDDLIH